MIYYYFDLTLLLLLLIVLLYVIQKELRTDGKAVQYIVLSTVLTLAFKYNWGTPFWGLEMKMPMLLVFVLGSFPITSIHLRF